MPDFLPSSADLQLFLPEIVLVLAILGVLLTPLFSATRNILAEAIAAAAGLGATLLAVLITRSLAISSPTACFGGMLLLDPFAWAIKLLLIGFACFVMALWFTDSHDRFIARGQAHNAPEFFALLLSSTLGLCLMVSTSNLLIIFLAGEIASLPVYILAGFRKNHRPGAQAAMKFVLFGAASTALMLYGISLLYGLFGTVDLHQIARAIATRQWPLHLTTTSGALFALALLGLLVGIGFKIAMVPFHFWCPDVFADANIDVATFLSVASPTAAIALLVRLLVILTGPCGAAGPLAWIPLALLVLGALTCFWANLAAGLQTNIRRLLAWSTIAQVGFMLLGMTALVAPYHLAHLATEKAALISPTAEVILFCLFLFLIVNGGIFITAAAIAQRLAGPTATGMSLGVDRVIPAAPSQTHPSTGTGYELSEYTGLARRAPILAAIMLVFLLSLAGIPLTIGFATRIKLITILFDTPGPLGFIAIAVIALNSLLVAFYCFRIIRQMYFAESELPSLIEIAPVTIVALVLAVPNIALFVAYTWVDHQSQRHAQIYLLTPPVPGNSAASKP